ncbi:MAG: hypothetical protein IJH95_04265 [Mogibacterium sp.]|nr:hypothetical protein [Mogibacterium sp.]
MKITGFAPIIVTQHEEELIKLFEDLGFERNHTKTGIEGGNNTNFQLKNEAGFRVNVASSNHIPQDLTAITINVDNFDEAYDFFIAHGFTNPRGDKVTETGSSTATLLFSPSGFAINIAQHIK